MVRRIGPEPIPVTGIVTRGGLPIRNAEVAVLDRLDGGNADIYVDEFLRTAADNPIMVDGNGRFSFFVRPGQYGFSVPAGADSMEDVIVGVMSSADTVGRATEEPTETPVIIELTPASLADGTVGAAYSQTLSPSGGVTPYAFSVSAGALPGGLVLDEDTGAIVGIPTTASSSVKFTITVSDADGNTRSIAYDIEIFAAAQAPAADSDNFDDGVRATGTWDDSTTTVAVSETGGEMVTPEGASAQTDTAYDLELKKITIQASHPNPHATAKSILEWIADSGNLIVKCQHDNALASFRDTIMGFAPLIYLPMDEESGTTLFDDSGNGRNASVNGSVTLSNLVLATGDAVETLTCGGTNSRFLTTYNLFTPSSKRTFFGLARRDSTGNRVLFAGGNTYLRCESGSNAITWTNNNQTNLVSWDAGAGVLTSAFDYALTYDDATRSAELFINGVSKGAQTIATAYGTTDVLQVSGRFGTNDCWIGPMGHFAVFGSILTAANIASLHNAAFGLGGSGGGLLVSVTDTGSVVYSQQFSAMTDGEYFGCYWSQNQIRVQRGGSYDTLADFATHSFTTDSRLTATKLKASSSNSAGDSGARNAKWDNYLTADVPVEAPPPATVLDEHVIWTSQAAINEEAGRQYSRIHQLNTYGVDKYIDVTDFLAGYGGLGNWNNPHGSTESGRTVLAEAKVRTTGNHGLSGLAAIDGVTPSAGWRILVPSQTDKKQNGVYVAAAGAWSRATDADAGAELHNVQIGVELGNTHARTGWKQTTSNPTLGTSDIVFTAVEPNQQQRMGPATNDLEQAPRVAKPIINGVYFRPGDGNVPAFLTDAAGWTTYCGKTTNWCKWTKDTGWDGIAYDLEGGNFNARENADGTFVNLSADQTRAYAAGAELMTAILAGFPTVDIYWYGHDEKIPRTWRTWQVQHLYGTADSEYDGFLLPYFVAGMASVSGATAARMIFMQTWCYKKPQAGLSEWSATDWQLACHRDVWGWNRDGTILDRFGNPHEGLLGMDWYFQNMWNDGGMGAANRFCWYPFIWAGNTSPGEGDFGLASPASRVTLQATELARFTRTLPYPRKGMTWFDYGNFSYALATATNGGYPAIDDLFAL